MYGQQPQQYPIQYTRQPMQYPIQPIQFPVIPPLNPFLLTMNPPQTQISEPQLPNNENVREQQNLIQSVQQVDQAAIQTFERPRQNETATRNISNLLILPIPAYPDQPPIGIPLLPYTTERNQQRRKSYRLIFRTHKRTDESEEDDFLDVIITRITMPQFPSHKIDIETAQ
ncbi:MAG: hypothetical protein EZS28_051326 [Streblomastix strix]|uniref:Uncharacterized protein n=1 Tax=Streblomastix strix TaxID=222440 RepID=A0A5J4T3X0_9EUKA|nr:MAG: hypothetical protein EZS28_051326 [Streblomastix strix]